MLETLAKVFFEFAKVTFFFAKVSQKLGIIIIMYRVATHCHPGSGRRRALENFGLVLVQFPVWWCLWTITPFIGSSRASKGEASRQPTPWPGSVNRDIFAKVPRKLCERAGESQSACWRGWASKPCQKKPSQQQSALRRDSVMLAACLKGYQEVIRDSLA